jgi:hypothetical protein
MRPLVQKVRLGASETRQSWAPKQALIYRSRRALSESCRRGEPADFVVIAASTMNIEVEVEGIIGSDSE